jgi:hypothetical protein
MVRERYRVHPCRSIIGSTVFRPGNVCVCICGTLGKRARSETSVMTLGMRLLKEERGRWGGRTLNAFGTEIAIGPKRRLQLDFQSGAIFIS